MVSHEPLEAGDDLPVAARVELHFDGEFGCGGPEFGESDELRQGERLAGDVGQGRAPPQRLGAPQAGGGIVEVAGGPGGACLLHQPLEAGAVEGLGVDVQGVALAPGDQQPGPDRPAELRHIVLQHAEAGAGRAAGPEVFDQLVPGHDLAVVDEQVDEQRPLLGAAGLDGLTVPHHLQGAQHLELHRRHITSGSPRFPGDESGPEAFRERV